MTMQWSSPQSDDARNSSGQLDPGAGAVDVVAVVYACTAIATMMTKPPMIVA